MSDLVGEFCEHYHAYNSISPQRRVMQERVLRDFVAHAGGDAAAAGAVEVRAYLASLVTTLQPATIRQRLNAIRPFFTWLWQSKLIDAERLMEVREVKPPRGGTKNKPNPYKRKEIQQFWRDLEDSRPWCACGKCKPGVKIDHAEMYLRRWRSGSSKWKRVEAYFMRAQIEAIVALALMGGLRREEIFRLELEDFHPDNHYIVVRGAAKNADGTHEDRIVPWSGEGMKTIVRRWLDLRAELAPPHDRPWLSLYRQHRLKPLRFCTLGGLLAKVGNGYELHRLRHTFATEALRAGMPLENVSKILGHSRVQQTLAYAELLEGDLVKGADKVATDFNRAVAARPLEVVEAA